MYKGIIKRIDDLGRIVIPKEIRNKFKIKEGDQVEIICDKNILLKKYSILDDKYSLFKNIVDSYYDEYKNDICITDKEKIIYASKNYSNYNDSLITDIILESINLRKDKYIKKQNITNNLVTSFYISPIIIDSDAVGSIIFIGDDTTLYDKRIIGLLKRILIKDIEE